MYWKNKKCSDEAEMPDAVVDLHLIKTIDIEQATLVLSSANGRSFRLRALSDNENSELQEWLEAIQGNMGGAQGAGSGEDVEVVKPRDMASTWNAYIKAFKEKDLNGVMAAVAETHTIVALNTANYSEYTFNDADGALCFHRGIFADVGSEDQVLAADSPIDEASCCAFLLWDTASSYRRCVSSFIFDPDSTEIVRHTMWYCVSDAPQGPPPAMTAPPDASSGPVAAQVAVLMDGFKKTDVTTSLYAEDAEVMLWKANTQDMTVFKGDELRGFQSTVAAIFERGNGAEEYEFKSFNISEAARCMFSSWVCPSCGITGATETVVFDANAKIVRHLYAIEEGDLPPQRISVEDRWNSFLGAFQARKLSDVTAGISETCIVVAVNAANSSEYIFKGVDGATHFFTGVFGDLEDSRAEQPDVWGSFDEESHAAFMCWDTASSYRRCVSSFIFDPDSTEIVRHTMWYCVSDAPQGPPPAMTAPPDASSGPVAAQVAVLMDGFKKTDVTTSLYAEDAEVMLWKANTQDMTVFKGDELRGFQSTVAAIFERGNGAEEYEFKSFNISEAARCMFSSWVCPSCGITGATETVVFDANAKIVRHLYAIEEGDLPMKSKKFEVHSGSLKKRGHVRLNWTTRFFVLHPGIKGGLQVSGRAPNASSSSGSTSAHPDTVIEGCCLYYFANEPRVGTDLDLLSETDERPRGVIPLDGASIRSNDSDANNEVEFIVTNWQGTEYPMRASSKYARDLWIKKIQNAIATQGGWQNQWKRTSHAGRK